MYYEI
ncbi:Iron-utilization periplasmic protein precursor, partial [Haemophilus influenzae]